MAGTSLEGTSFPSQNSKKDDTPTAIIMDVLTTSVGQNKDEYVFVCPCMRCRKSGWKEVVEGEDELFPWDDSLGPPSERGARVEMRPIPGEAEYKHYNTIMGK